MFWPDFLSGESVINNEINIVLIMIIAGGLGGLANYLTTEVAEDERHPCIKRVAVGSIAAIAVPAFLNMISSSILRETMSSIEYFVFAGFCLLAGFSSKAFLTSMSKSLTDRINKVEDRQNNLESEVDPILEKETEVDDLLMDSFAAVDLDESDIKVLQSLNNPKFTRRYLKGVINDSGLEDKHVLVVLNKLIGLKLVNQKAGKDKGLFWLTQKGRKVLKSSENADKL